mmetsp:Transcript_50089/g.88301  ORF Transcript_50089/g.88301 Transcript_50089/m.88301 type:complete len:380 (+) Transcript_50089:101-1240(+)
MRRSMFKTSLGILHHVVFQAVDRGEVEHHRGRELDAIELLHQLCTQGHSLSTGNARLHQWQIVFQVVNDVTDGRLHDIIELVPQQTLVDVVQVDLGHDLLLIRGARRNISSLGRSLGRRLRNLVFLLVIPPVVILVPPFLFLRWLWRLWRIDSFHGNCSSGLATDIPILFEDLVGSPAHLFRFTLLASNEPGVSLDDHDVSEVDVIFDLTKHLCGIRCAFQGSLDLVNICVRLSHEANCRSIQDRFLELLRDELCLLDRIRKVEELCRESLKISVIKANPVGQYGQQDLSHQERCVTLQLLRLGLLQESFRLGDGSQSVLKLLRGDVDVGNCHHDFPLLLDVTHGMERICDLSSHSDSCSELLRVEVSLAETLLGESLL